MTEKKGGGEKCKEQRKETGAGRVFRKRWGLQVGSQSNRGQAALGVASHLGHGVRERGDFSVSKPRKFLGVFQYLVVHLQSPWLHLTLPGVLLGLAIP